LLFFFLRWTGLSALNRWTKVCCEVASLEELRQISPPPSCLTQTEWDEVGFTVPADYRAIVDTYGAGSFGDFLWVMQPVHSEDRLSITVQIPLARRTLHELANDVVPSEVPYDIDSLIPCAFTPTVTPCTGSPSKRIRRTGPSS
jgi:hypothetical protein